ncbi:MAG: hypothetical protein MJE68_27995, partial [Proteobacteria bacterium]|nr:hypothetical protein [Pseudomonadota bacterium]
RYIDHDILAASLHPKAYKEGHCLADILARAIKCGFKFESYDTFGKKEIQARTKLYCQIAESMWSPAAFKKRTEGEDGKGGYIATYKKASN